VVVRSLVGALEITRLAYSAPGGRRLFDDVSFRVGDGEHAALVGANGVGKTTLVRLIAGDERAASGTISVDGRLGVMRQFVGSIRDQTTVRELLLGVSAPEIREADARLVAAERAAEGLGSPEDGVRLANAWAHWGDVGGYDAELLWDACTVAAMRAPLVDVASRPVRTLSGGEQKRLVLEALLRGDADVLVLDEPDNYLDVPGKRWLESWLRQTTKTVLYVSHDRELLEQSGAKVITLEGRGAWTHGATFATWNYAREERLARIDDEHCRWQDERKHLEVQIRELRRRSQVTDAFASRFRATHTKLRRHDAAAPRERPRDQAVSIRIEGGRTGKRALVIEDLSFPGIVDPFST
jgi:ATPase subunit of ABC transporter with duplicated ATPase domains